MAGEYYRVATRCDRCSSYWSVPPRAEMEARLNRCPCGGFLASIDTRAEAEKLPYVPMKPEPPKEKKNG